METEKNTRLLSEFPPQTAEEWKEAAVQLLKGRPFEKTLITPTYEGFDLQPIYMGETMPRFAHLSDQPGMGSKVRGSRLEGYLEAGWLVSQELSASTPEALNAIALHELEKGQNELNIWLDRPTREGTDAGPDATSTGVCGLSLSTTDDLMRLLQGVHPEMISLYFQSGMAAPALYGLLMAFAEKSGTDPQKLRGCLGMDPLGWLSTTGTFAGDPGQVYDVMAGLVEAAGKQAPQLQVMDIQGHAYHNAGASSVQELAAILATGVAYIQALVERGVSAPEAIARMRLSVSIGPNYFIEIAKLRALRLLWNRVLDAFEVPEDSRHIHVHARTGQWNKTVFDPYVNMLRTTTEAFSAVVGGCDSLHIAPFDEIIRESDTFSRRIARNTHAILGEECGMMQVIDPAGGSYAVETLTDEVAREAWKQFQEIEAAGGMLAVLESGSLQESIEAVRAEKMKNIQRRKDVIVGTNSYPNATEKILQRVSPDYKAAAAERIAALEKWKAARDADALGESLERVRSATGAERAEALVKAARAGATIGEMTAALGLGEPGPTVTPVRLKRAAEEFEALRFAARSLAESGKAPRVHQLNMGPSRRYRARADWTSSFFQVAGVEVLNDDDYDDVEAAIAALKESGARAAIITSDDETYATVVETLARGVKALDGDIRLFLAGAPGDSEESWRSAGVDDFVHIRVNNYQFNRALLESMGASL